MNDSHMCPLVPCVSYHVQNPAPVGTATQLSVSLPLCVPCLHPQVAPLLGIVGRPMADAAAAAECFEGEELPAPPSALAAAAAVTSGCHNLPKACTPGLLMPEIETLVPSDHARHTYEMQASEQSRGRDTTATKQLSIPSQWQNAALSKHAPTALLHIRSAQPSNLVCWRCRAQQYCASRCCI